MVGVTVERVRMRDLHHSEQSQQNQAHHGNYRPGKEPWPAMPAEMWPRFSQKSSSTY
jgi:hypothetical protein